MRRLVKKRIENLRKLVKNAKKRKKRARFNCSLSKYWSYYADLYTKRRFPMWKFGSQRALGFVVSFSNEANYRNASVIAIAAAFTPPPPPPQQTK
jgi:hypothetical protein